jgi:hypothetical protein
MELSDNDRRRFKGKKARRERGTAQGYLTFQSRGHDLLS